MYKILEKLYEGIDLYKIYIIIFKDREILFGNRRNVSNYRPISLGTSFPFEKLLGKVKYKKETRAFIRKGNKFPFFGLVMGNPCLFKRCGICDGYLYFF